jgi:glycerophosphoryl diester phosphodiesterase
MIRFKFKHDDIVINLLFTALFFSFVSCSSSSKKLNQSVMLADHFDLQGHRGCRGLMPENTIPAMLYAMDLGVTTLELDVVISAEGKVVVSHEPWISSEIGTKEEGTPVTRSEEMSLNIFRMNYDEVIKYDMGLRPHPRFPDQKKMKAVKPLLTDVIDAVIDYAAKKGIPAPRWNVETKCLPSGDNIYHPEPSVFVDLLLGVIREKKITHRVTIQSFDIRTLQYLHKTDSAVSIALLIDEKDGRTLNLQLEELGFVPSVYSPHYSLVSAKLIQSCHKQGVKVIPWTVNDANKMKELKNMGVDGLITDYPDRFAGFVNRFSNYEYR